MEYVTNYPAQPEGGALEVSKVLGEKPSIHPSCRIKDSTLGAYTSLGVGTQLIESIFGDYSYTAGQAQIIYSEVGKYCSIANNVRINPGNHPSWRVSQHHMTYRRVRYGLCEADDTEFFDWRREHRCSIGHDVWIGHGAIIMPGVAIGTGAIIGAGAVITKDIGPYEVAVGVAARVIKKRFDPPTIDHLLSSAWWDWDRNTLEENFRELLDVGTFLKRSGK